MPFALASVSRPYFSITVAGALGSLSVSRRCNQLRRPGRDHDDATTRAHLQGDATEFQTGIPFRARQSGVPDGTPAKRTGRLADQVREIPHLKSTGGNPPVAKRTGNTRTSTGTNVPSAPARIGDRARFLVGFAFTLHEGVGPGAGIGLSY